MDTGTSSGQQEHLSGATQPDSTSLQAHVAALPPAIRQHLLRAAGVSNVDSAAAAPASVHTSWGFVLDLPGIPELKADAAARASRLAHATASQPPASAAVASVDAVHSAMPPATANESRAEGPGLQASLPSAVPPADLADGRPLFLQHLDASRLFHCPDAVDAMAEAYNISDAFEGLQGSTITPARDAEGQRALGELRASLRGALRSAWSREATRRGIAAARGGGYEEALKCYQQALELDRRNVDAHVARGAALANQKQWPQAIAALDMALEIEPGDENAAKYMAAIRQRVPQALLSPPSRTPVAPACQQSGAARLFAASQRDGNRATPARASATGMSGVRLQSAVDSGQNGAAPAAEPRVSPTHSPAARRQASPSSEGSGGDRPQPSMDMQRALALVSDHYSRNAPAYRTSSPSVWVLNVTTSPAGALAPSQWDIWLRRRTFCKSTAVVHGSRFPATYAFLTATGTGTSGHVRRRTKKEKRKRKSKHKKRDEQSGKKRKQRSPS